MLNLVSNFYQLTYSADWRGGDTAVLVRIQITRAPKDHRDRGPSK